MEVSYEAFRQIRQGIRSPHSKHPFRFSKDLCNLSGTKTFQDYEDQFNFHDFENYQIENITNYLGMLCVHDAQKNQFVPVEAHLGKQLFEMTDESAVDDGKIREANKTKLQIKQLLFNKHCRNLVDIWEPYLDQRGNEWAEALLPEFEEDPFPKREFTLDELKVTAERNESNERVTFYCQFFNE